MAKNKEGAKTKSEKDKEIRLQAAYILSEGRAAAGLKAFFGLAIIILAQFLFVPLRGLISILGGGLILWALIEFKLAHSKSKHHIAFGHTYTEYETVTEKQQVNRSPFFSAIKWGVGLILGFFIAIVIINIIIALIFGISILALIGLL